MKTLFKLTHRNIKLYFKDKGMFITSLITPIILLVLYITFLGKVFKDSFVSQVTGAGVEVSMSLIDGLIGGQLISSILSTCCVTIAFCANIVMIQDKYSGAFKDFVVSPVKRSTLALSYFLASLFSTLIVCYFTLALGFIYIAMVGWYLTFVDVLLVILDVFILCLFGTALSSVIHFFLKSQGEASAVGTIVSSLYGFICGAYMPMSQFPSALRKTLTFLPGTYGTSILKNHTMISTLKATNFPKDVVDGMKDTLDINIYFFDNLVKTPIMYVILVGSILILLGIYVLLNVFQKKAKK